MAMTFAYHLLKEGRADVIFAGGGDELSEPLYHVYSMLGRYPRKRKRCGRIRPFDQNRNGTVLGEGSGIVVLETLEHAKKRGQTSMPKWLAPGFQEHGWTSSI